MARKNRYTGNTLEKNALRFLAREITSRSHSISVCATIREYRILHDALDFEIAGVADYPRFNSSAPSL